MLAFCLSLQCTKAEESSGRAALTTDWPATPYVILNGVKYQRNYIQVAPGDNVKFSAVAKEGYTGLKYSWLKVTTNNEKNKTELKSLRKYNSVSDFEVIDSATIEDAGTYVMRTFIPKKGAKDYYFFVDVQTEDKGSLFDWKENTPIFAFDFSKEYPDLPAPTKTHNFYQKSGKKANVREGEWWSVFWGDKLNPKVKGDTLNAFTTLIKKFETDFAYMRDSIGWPPDINAREGWKSFVYVIGSGLTNDDADPEQTGGWQSATWVDDRHWPCVWCTWAPIEGFQDGTENYWQQDAMIHEGIHALLADYEGCKNAAWFHEAGNTWLQQEMAARRAKSYGAPGWLDPGPLIAPFQPIECYSGWLQDGSFGGPSAEGVNVFNEYGQVCTWKNILGGSQYANPFAVFLGSNVHQGSVAWIWKNCKTRVLEGIADSIGDYDMRRLILQYRAKQATMQLGNWSKGYREGMNWYFGTHFGAEYEPSWIKCPVWIGTPYQTMTKCADSDWYAPDTIVTPGWSGGNQIPIHVEGDTVEVEFLPEGPGMMAQLCYRTKDGKDYYSQPVNCGTVSMALPEPPANGVLFLAVANTDYLYESDETRKKHHDYRVAFGKGVLGLASPNIRWYFYENTLNETNYKEVTTGIDEVFEKGETVDMTPSYGVLIMNSVIRKGDNLNLRFNGVDPSDVTLSIISSTGALVKNVNLTGDSFTLPAEMRSGYYIFIFNHNGRQDVYKTVVK